MATNSRILWGAGYENQLLVGRPFYQMVTDRVPRPPSQRGQGPSGVEDAFIVGRDYTLWLTARWIPDGTSDVTMSPLSGPVGWQAFFDWARDANPFRFVPDDTAPSFYVDGCYLVDPLGQGPLGTLDDVIQRDIPFQVRNPTVDFHQALRGMLWEYAPQGDTTKMSPAPTATRADAATCTTYVGSDGLLHVVAANVLRDRHYIAGVRTTLLEATIANLVLQPENFGTTWTAVGTPTRTPAAKTCGALSLDLIGDDDPAAGEYYQQTIGFTGNAAKAVSIYVAAGTIQAAGGSFVQLRDATAAANRLLGTVTFSGAGVPSVAMTTGTLARSVALGNGVYRLEFKTTAVTAANTNNILVGGAVVAGEQGNIYAGGVQAENAISPSSYIQQTTVSLTRAADLFSVTLPAGALTPMASWWYVKFVEQGTIAALGTKGTLSLGNTGNDSLMLYEASGVYAVQHAVGGVTVAAGMGAAPVFGDTVELLAVLFADGSVQLHQSLNAAAETVSAQSAALAFGTSWTTSVLKPDSRGSGTEGFMGLVNVRIGSGSAVNTVALARLK